MLVYLISLVKSLFMLTGSYSINVFPEPLPKDEETKCIEAMLLGDKDARNKLIEHNLRLVAHIVKKYENREYDADDLISIGTIGLVKGIDSYKPLKNTKITTYAARCIENEILMYYRANKKHINNISLNDSIGFDKDGNEINLIDILKSDAEDIADELNNKNNVQSLHQYLSILTAREKEIIIQRYGLYNQQELTQKEIAKNLKISRSYVSRIEKRALSKILREFMKNKGTL